MSNVYTVSFIAEYDTSYYLIWSSALVGSLTGIKKPRSARFLQVTSVYFIT